MLHTARANPTRAFSLTLNAVVAAAAATTMGLAAVYMPLLTVLGIVGVTVLIAFVRAPAWVPVVVAVTILAGADVMRSELLAAGAGPGTAGLLGLGRVSLALALLAIARAILRRDVPRVPTGLVVAFALYGFSILLSALVAMVRGAATPTILADIQREVFYMGGFLIGLVAVQTAEHRIRLYRAMALVAVACAVGSLLYWGWASEFFSVPPFLGNVFEHARLLNIEVGGAQDRASFPFVFTHPNLAAFIYVSMAVFAIPPLIESKGRGDRLLAATLMVATAGGVLATQSRTSLIALAVGTLAYVVLTRGIPKRTRMIIVLTVAIVGIGVWFAYDLLPDNRSFSDARTLDSRREIWADGFSLFAESPLLGNGFKVSTFGIFGVTDGGLSIHNEYLGRLIDGGLVGFALWGILVGTFVVMAFSLWRSQGARSAEGTSLLAFFSVLAVVGMTNQPWAGGASPIFIWLFLGMGAGAYLAQAREQSPDPTRDDRLLPDERRDRLLVG